ncbi:hypothetical protein EV658_1544 [Phaeovulum veldkampii DSM 11550]|nr:hypothetical protein EV658_1544 [Phaeovulum veldkampii DSM 11550]
MPLNDRKIISIILQEAEHVQERWSVCQLCERRMDAAVQLAMVS